MVPRDSFITTHLVSLSAGEELGGVSVSDKITGLAKKNKQLCVEVEKEKTKCRQSNTRIQALEKQLSTLKRIAPKPKQSNSTDCCKERETVRLLQERLAASELKASEQRNKIQFLQKELKVAHKVVISEVGKDIPFQKLLNCPVGFKGRAEEMQTLKLKVQQLEKRLKERTDQEETGVPPVRGKWTTVNNPHEERYQSKLEGIQKERRAAIEKLSADFEALKTEYNKLKQITDISRARNMCLTREMKTLTSQLSALRVKSEHDDELVEVLINQEKHLRELLIKANKKNSEQKDVVVQPAHTPINEEQPINIEQG
eukprot:XP_011619839.1 PREDICTED: coiled-coil domain-containing protein 13-like [Takifugu rubripes]